MLRSLIFLLVLALVATPAIKMIGAAQGCEKAISFALGTGAPGSSDAMASASGQDLPRQGLGHRGKSYCLSGLGISRADAVADLGGESNEVRWTDLQSSPIELHLPPAHPPPVSAA